jgi:hypothetical protein
MCATCSPETVALNNGGRVAKVVCYRFLQLCVHVGAWINVVTHKPDLSGGRSESTFRWPATGYQLSEEGKNGDKF